MYNLGITQILFLQNKHVSIFLILTKQDCKCDFLKNFGLYYLLNSQLFPSLIESGRQPLKLSDPVGWKQLNRRLLTQWVMTWCCMISDGNGILEIRRKGELHYDGKPESITNQFGSRVSKPWRTLYTTVLTNEIAHWVNLA